MPLATLVTSSPSRTQSLSTVDCRVLRICAIIHEEMAASRTNAEMCAAGIWCERQPQAELKERSEGNFCPNVWLCLVQDKDFVNGNSIWRRELWKS